LIANPELFPEFISSEPASLNDPKKGLKEQNQQETPWTSNQNSSLRKPSIWNEESHQQIPRARAGRSGDQEQVNENKSSSTTSSVSNQSMSIIRRILLIPALILALVVFKLVSKLISKS
jgi:hypothetical protein